MNREILFRGKSLDTGEWVEGYLVKKIDPIYTDIETYCILKQKKDKFGVLEPLVTWTKVDAETIGQFTGLTDMNGVKIFEGDIVELPREDEFYKVVWSNDTARFAMTSGTIECDFDNYWGCHTEVIDNIHDNPKILKGEK